MPLSAALQAAPAGALYLLEDPNAHSASLGGAVAAGSEGVESLRSNPAGLAGAEQVQAGLAYHRDGAGWSHSWLGLAVPWGSFSLGLEFLSSSLDPIPDYDAFGNESGSINISSQVYGAGLAYRTWNGKLDLGLAGRGFSSAVGTYSNGGWGADLGVQAALPWGFRAGLSAVNFGSQSAYISKAAPLPMGERIALQWMAVSGPGFSLQARGQYDYFPNAASVAPLKLGLEAGLGGAFYVSSGLQMAPLNSLLTYGAGYRGPWLGLNYAYIPDAIFGGSHLVTLKTNGWPGSSQAGALKPLEEASGISTPLSGEEALPPLVAWSLEVMDLQDRVLKTLNGEGPLPKAFTWDGTNDAGQKEAPSPGLRLRVTATDRQGVTTITERPLGQELRARALQHSAPLFAGYTDAKGGLTLRTQMGKEISGVKEWKLKVRNHDGSLVREIKGTGPLPRTLDLTKLAMPSSGGLKYLFQVDSEGGSYSSEGQIAEHVRPKELLLERPSFDAAKGALRVDLRPELKAGIREWTLTIKSADGLVLKTLNGSGPLPKELAFDPARFHIPGLDLTARRSGSAFVQLSLAYLDSKGRAGELSDVLPLTAPRKIAGIQDPLAGDEFQPVAGREVVVVVGSALLSSDASQAATACRLFRVPEGIEIRSWKMEMASGAQVVHSADGKGSPPAYLYWDGATQGAASAEGLAAAKPRLTLKEANGTITTLEESEPMRRSFSALPDGKLARRVHASWFSQGEAELQPEMVERLDLVAELLKAHPQGRAVVQGHCSKEGDEATNEALSKQRASVVMAYLAERGVPRSQLSAESFSNQLLLDERLDEDAVRRNRRVDVVIVE